MNNRYTYSSEMPKEREPSELGIKLDKRSNVPIFVQIENAIKYQIATGHLQPGNRLPSVRKLAKALDINPNTVDRAYMTLEQSGFIIIEKGRGTFVNDASDHLPTAEKKHQLDIIIKEFLNKAFKLGLNAEEILDEIKSRMPK